VSDLPIRARCQGNRVFVPTRSTEQSAAMEMASIQRQLEHEHPADLAIERCDDLVDQRANSCS
jgi:hypothetical protein